MGKELQVSLGVIGVLLIMFLAMVYQRVFLNPTLDTDGIRTSIQQVDDDQDKTRQVDSQPTIVSDPLNIGSNNPRQGARNPRNPRPSDRENIPTPSRGGARFTPVPHVER